MNNASVNRELDRALALLISSTKRKRRAVPLTDVSAALSIARASLGTTAAVAKAIGLSGKMVGQFARVDDLDPTARALVADRTIDSVDAVVQLAQLGAAEQRVVAQEIAAKQLDTKDVRAVVEMRKLRADRDLTEILERVKSSKTQRQYVIEFIVRGGLTANAIRDRLRHFLPTTSVVDVVVRGTLGRIIFDQKGYSGFKDEAKRRNITVKELATRLTTETWNRV